MNTQAKLAWALLLVVHATMACSQGGEGGAGSSRTDGLEAGARCSVDAECRSGLACNESRKVCACTSNASCPGDLKCQPITGLCVADVPGCKADADCHDPGKFCDTQSGACKSLRSFCQSCRIDAECGAGNRCLGVAEGKPQGFCATGCTDDSACPNPRSHCDGGQCVPNTTCEDITPCTPDTLETCDKDEDCTQGRGQICDVAGGLCLARASGCGFGQACDPVTQTCVPACGGDSECQRGQRCLNSVCQLIASCESESECAANKVCRKEPGEELGECVGACTRSASCPLNQVCTHDANQRLVCQSGCGSNSDCQPNERCDPDTGTCQGGPGTCQVSDVCEPCQVCNNSNACVPAGSPYCGSCSNEGTFDSACGAQGFCYLGTCAPRCPEEGCPKGFLCKRFVDSGGTEIGRGCYPFEGTCANGCQ
ncbi:MAG: hypothetical protein HY901_22160 [Deltaproteobacteria bacterium]|nr:hypothetical protein [Deltaproteobacteria bacterium]